MKILSNIKLISKSITNKVYQNNNFIKNIHTNAKANLQNDTNPNYNKNKATKFFKLSNNKSGFDYRMFLYRDELCTEKASFFDDIPYKNEDNKEKTFNCVFEVPYGESAKMEMSREPHNPIMQDTKKNKFTKQKFLRFYKLTPLFNYGFIPQTWENSNFKFRNKYIGDNDPLDVIELSIANKISVENSNSKNNYDKNNNFNKSEFSYVNNSRISIGDISKIHVIGSFCLIDQDEVDWKILALNAHVCDADDALKWLSFAENQERLRSIMQWFKVYKTFEGKKENVILDNDKIFSPEETLEFIEENHKFYLEDAKKI